MHHWLYISLELTTLCTLRTGVLFYLTNEGRETKSGGLITKSGVKEMPPPKFSSLSMGNFYCQLPSLFEFLCFVHNHRNALEFKRSNLSAFKSTALPSSTTSGVKREQNREAVLACRMTRSVPNR